MLSALKDVAEVQKVIDLGKDEKILGREPSQAQMATLRSRGYRGPQLPSMRRYHEVVKELAAAQHYTQAMHSGLLGAGVDVRTIPPRTPLKKVLSAARRQGMKINMEKLAQVLLEALGSMDASGAEPEAE